MKSSTKTIIIVAICMIIAVLLIAKINFNKGNEVILVAVDENPPYTYTTAPPAAYFDEGANNVGKSSTTLKYQGFDIDVMNEVAKRAGLMIQYCDMRFAEMINQMQQAPAKPKNFIQKYLSEKFELNLAIGGITITDERKKFAEFSTPYATGGPAIVTLKDKNINSQQSLAGRTVGVELATTNVAQAEAIKGIKLKTYRNQQDLLIDLLDGSLDAVVMDRIAAAFYAKERNMNQLKIIELAAVEDFGMMARKGDTKLIGKIDKALASMKADGKLQAIYDKWFAR